MITQGLSVDANWPMMKHVKHNNNLKKSHQSLKIVSVVVFIGSYVWNALLFLGFILF
jgi:hypothetical protein